MPSRKIRFKNQDGQELAGILDLPVGEPATWALFAHCFTCSKNARAAAHVSRALTDAGIAVLRFDFTGIGESEGEFADTTFSTNIGDLVAAADWLADEHTAPALLVGHSLGGAAVLAAARDIDSARAVATIGAPSTPAHVRHMFDDALDDIEADGEADVELGGRRFTIGKAFLDDLDEHDLPGSLGGLRLALLLMHAPLDDVVEIDNATDLFVNARHPKSFLSLDEADHLLSRREDSYYAGRVLAAWASRYLPSAGTGKDDDAPSGDAGEAVAHTAGGGFRTPMSVAGHALVADEPENYGGTGSGPSPYDLLAAALASCTSMTLRMYAERKKLDFDSATVRVRHDKIHAKDCEDCETADGKVDVFSRTLELAGDLSVDERQRLAEIADKCPVHRTLHGEVRVETELADD